MEQLKGGVSMTLAVSFEMKSAFYNENFRTYWRSGLKQKLRTVFGYIRVLQI
jgi:hypothetical protein